MAAQIVDDVYVDEIGKGYALTILIDGPAGFFAAFNTIKMDFKYEKRIESLPILSLELGDGIVRSGDSITVSVSDEFTPSLDKPTLFADIKAQINGGDPLLIMECRFTVVNYVTP